MRGVISAAPLSFHPRISAYRRGLLIAVKADLYPLVLAGDSVPFAGVLDLIAAWIRHDGIGESTAEQKYLDITAASRGFDIQIVCERNTLIILL